MVNVVVKDPTGAHTVRQKVLRGVSQGVVADHLWASVGGRVAFIPLHVEIDRAELGESMISALIDSGVTVEEVA